MAIAGRQAYAGAFKTAAAGPPRMSLSPSARHRVLFLILCFVWGTTWIAMKVGAARVAPEIFAGTRWTVAGLALIAFRLVRGETVTIRPRAIGRTLAVALLMISLNQVIALYSLRHTTAGLGAVITSALMPVSLLGFSVISGQETFSLRQAGAIALGVVGILVLFGPSALNGDLDTLAVLGAFGVMLSTLCYAAGTVMARKLMRSVAPVPLAAITNLFGGVSLLLVSVVIEPSALTGAWSWPAVFAWLYLLLAGSLMASIIYFVLVRDWGASRTGTYAFVSPVVAVAIGSGLFGERLGASDVVGMGLMLLAAGLVLKRPG
jgi:drug/metabolite transporter (DMT)-like permease